MGRLLIISLDAVAGSVWENAPAGFRNIDAFKREAETVTGVRSVFLSNTYPIHCSIVTGKHPCDHKVLNNVTPFPEPYPKWTYRASAIKARTLWRAADDAGLDVAAVLWPCTGSSPHIRWNIPEIAPVPGQNQILTNLKEGNKMQQLRVILRHWEIVKRASPANVDELTSVCAADILRRKKPDLTLVHLTRSDYLGHAMGPGPETDALIYEAADKSLGMLLEAAGDETEIIVLSDHGCIGVHTELTPNDILVDMGLLGKAAPYISPEVSYVPGGSGCYFECCGGSAFFSAGTLPEPEILTVRERTAELPGFARFLTDEELRVSGRGDLPFGFGLKPGYAAGAVQERHKGNHGYPLDVPDYEVFYAIRARGFSPGTVRRGGSLLDIAPIAASLLGIKM